MSALDLHTSMAAEGFPIDDEEVAAIYAVVDTIPGIPNISPPGCHLCLPIGHNLPGTDNVGCGLQSDGKTWIYNPALPMSGGNAGDCSASHRCICKKGGSTSNTFTQSEFDAAWKVTTVGGAYVDVSPGSAGACRECRSCARGEYMYRESASGKYGQCG